MGKEKTIITVVRHGETQWNVLGYYQGVLNSPLTEKGIEQALKNCGVSRFLKLENEWKLEAWGEMDASEK